MLMRNFCIQNRVFNFKKIIICRKNRVWHNIKYFPQIFKLYITYLRNLEDDFSLFNKDLLEGMLEFIEKSDFYIVIEKEEVCGFFALTNFVGTPKTLYSAEITTCFNKKYWGVTTKLLANNFKEYCLNELNLQKLKALIYAENHQTRAILKTCGFEKEATLCAETLRNGKPQDIYVYSFFKRANTERNKK